MESKLKLTAIVFLGVLPFTACKIPGPEKTITALIRNYLQENDKILFNQNCKIQTFYDCLVECDGTKNPSNCTLNSCVYTCYLFSKPKTNDCSKLITYALLQN